MRKRARGQQQSAVDPTPKPQLGELDQNGKAVLCISCMKHEARLLGDPCDITDRPFFCCLACAAVWGTNAVVNSQRRWCATHTDWSNASGQCQACNRELLRTLCPRCRATVNDQAGGKAVANV